MTDTPTPTPGQLCYEAYCRAMQDTLIVPWRTVLPASKVAWEAAAQAVIDAWQTPSGVQTPLPDDSMALIDEARPFFEDAFAGVIEAIEVRPQRRGLRVVALVATDDQQRLNRCLRVFDETWWLANCHRSNALLVFDYETISSHPDDVPAEDERHA